MNAARFRFSALLLLFLFPFAGYASVTVQNLRLWQAPDHTRLVFDLSGPLEHRLFTLTDPDRIVIDMEGATLQGSLTELDLGGTPLGGVRTGSQEGNTLRVVLDLKRELRPRTFVLKPAGPYGHRLVIDLYTEAPDDENLRRAPPATPKTPAERRREIVIAIDAGHGGEDPGAVGRRYRTREKDVTLAVAREVARLVAAAPGMKPVLTRDGDYYVGLRQRFEKARRHAADVFVSIHADAIPGRHANGSSVYALSERGATSAMAKVLADRENAADLIGGVSLNDKDDVLAKVLLDLSHTKTIEDSLALGDDILVELDRIGPLHLRRVAQAGFMVLKAPDIPSVLVETAFISNPSEEKKLRTRWFQRQLADSIFRGIQRYLERRPPVRPVHVAAAPSGGAREHVVRPGETLAAIARKYDVHIDVLRFANNLNASEPSVGSRLRIPD